MTCSSSSFDARMVAFGKPASSSIRRACCESQARSPESSRMPTISLPCERSQRPASIACVDPVERAVGVDEEHAVRGERARVREERLALVAVEHDPAVRVRAAHRDPVEPAGERVRGRVAAADVGGPARGEAAVDPLGAAQPELDHRLAARGEADAGRLRRDERLEVHDREERRLEEHARDDRAGDAHERLVREDDRALRHRVHVDVELESPRARRGSRARRAARRRRRAARRGTRGPPRRSASCSTRSTTCSSPAATREAAVERVLAERERRTQASRAAMPLLPGGVRHRQLVEVGEQRERRAVELRWDGHARPPGVVDVVAQSAPSRRLPPRAAPVSTFGTGGSVHGGSARRRRRPFEISPGRTRPARVAARARAEGLRPRLAAARLAPDRARVARPERGRPARHRGGRPRARRLAAAGGAHARDPVRRRARAAPGLHRRAAARRPRRDARRGGAAREGPARSSSRSSRWTSSSTTRCRWTRSARPTRSASTWSSSSTATCARYEFLKWGTQAFERLRIVPPGIGICHQVNLEFLAARRPREGRRLRTPTRSSAPTRTRRW